MDALPDFVGIPQVSIAHPRCDRITCWRVTDRRVRRPQSFVLDDCFVIEEIIDSACATVDRDFDPVGKLPIVDLVTGTCTHLCVDWSGRAICFDARDWQKGIEPILTQARAHKTAEFAAASIFGTAPTGSATATPRSA